MGWSSGTDVCTQLWGAVRKYVPEKDRVRVLAKVVDLLMDQDWDCVEEIEDNWPESKKALKKVLGDGYEEV